MDCTIQANCGFLTCPVFEVSGHFSPYPEGRRPRFGRGLREKKEEKVYIGEIGLQARAGSLITPNRCLQVRQQSFRLNANGVVRHTRWELPRLRAPLMVNL